MRSLRSSAPTFHLEQQHLMRLASLCFICTHLYSQVLGAPAAHKLESSTIVEEAPHLLTLPPRPEASNTGFTISASPAKVQVVLGGTGVMTVMQSNPAFTGTVTYTIVNLSGIGFVITMVGNTATINFSAPLDTPLGTRFGILQGSSQDRLQQLAISIVVIDRPKILSPAIVGNISISSDSRLNQVIDFTRLGSSDWFATGGSAGTDPSCLYNGPCATTRKLGGSGLVAATNGGTKDGWFYPFSPNLATVTWSDGTAAPNGLASHINNTFVQFQAFSGTQTRVLTIVAGIIGGGTLITNFHMTDGATPDVTDIHGDDGTGIRVFTVRYNAASLGHQLVVTFSHQGGELLFYGAALQGTLSPQSHLLQIQDNLPAFLGAVTGGDSLVLPDGYVFSGHLILPARQDDGVVEIRSNTSIPAGQRVRPGDLKATLVSPDEMALIQNDINNADHLKRAAHGWRFVGIEMTANNTKAYLNYGLISFGFGDNPLVSDISRNISFQRCYIHGDGHSNYVKGIIGNANSISIVDSYLSGFVSTFMEANAINIFSSAGPIQIINNYLEASAENIMIGGSGPDIGPSLVPTKGVIQNNYFYKQPSWRGGAFIIKNLLEFKDGYNFLVDSNVFENCWAANQTGFALLLTPRTVTAAGAMTSSISITNHVDTITYSNNIIRHAGSGLNVGLYDDLAIDSAGQTIPPAKLLWVHDITVRNNLFDDLSQNYAPSAHGIQIFGPPNNFIMDHNTFNFTENTNDQGWWLANNTGVAPSNASITKNDFGADLYGDSRGPTAAVLTGAVFSFNNIRNGSPSWSSTPLGATTTLLSVAPTGVGADVSGLLLREVSVKNGNRP